MKDICKPSRSKHIKYKYWNKDFCIVFRPKSFKEDRITICKRVGPYDKEITKCSVDSLSELRELIEFALEEIAFMK